MGVRFRLWAPRAADVALVLDGSEAEPVPMRQEPDGWWSVTTDRAAAGSRYRYRVDGGDYPDPASRYQPDGVHGASEVIDPGAYRWSDTGWRGRRWEEMVIYELHLGTFSESGNFAGAISHLDDLVALGVTAIELMPIAQFPGRRNWGYDGVQLFAPASAYGRPEDLKALVEACHARGLAMLLDVVYNHFGPEGNYLHVISPRFLHRAASHAVGRGDQLRRRREPAGARLHDRRTRSIGSRSFNFDGLRLDAVHAIIDDSDTDILTELAQTVRRRIADRTVHLVLENDENEARRLRRQVGRPVGYTAQWNDDLHHVLHVLATGRTGGYYGDYAEEPIALLGRALASGFVYQGEPSPYRGGEARGEPSGASAGDRLCLVPAEPRPDRQHAVRRAHRRRRTRGAGPCGGRDRAAVAADPAPVHGRGMGDVKAVHVLLRFRAGPGRCGARGASARVRAICRIRRGGGAGPHSRRDRRGQLRCVAASTGPSASASRTRTWLERYRRMLRLRRDAIVPRLAGIGPGGAFRRLGPAALRVGMDARRRRAAAAVRQFRRCGGAARRSAVRRNAAVLHRSRSRRGTRSHHPAPRSI